MATFIPRIGIQYIVICAKIFFSQLAILSTSKSIL
jgi:hypothetical protein